MRVRVTAILSSGNPSNATRASPLFFYTMSFSLSFWGGSGGTNSNSSSTSSSSSPAAPAQSSPQPPPSTQHPPPAPAAVDDTLGSAPLPQSKRMARQLGLIFGGSTFLLLSLRASSRSILRRRLATVPTFYHPSNRPPVEQGSSATDAVEALQLATLSVMSAAMIMVGGGAFALDVSSVEELRGRFRKSQQGAEWKKQEREMEEEFEEWVVDVLARKEMKDQAKRRAQEARDDDDRRER